MYTINPNDDRRVQLDGLPHATFEDGASAAWYVVQRQSAAELDAKFSKLADDLERLKTMTKDAEARCAKCPALEEQVQALLAEQAAATERQPAGKKGRKGGTADPTPGSGPPPQNPEQ